MPVHYFYEITGLLPVGSTCNPTPYDFDPLTLKPKPQKAITPKLTTGSSPIFYYFTPHLRNLGNHDLLIFVGRFMKTVCIRLLSTATGTTKVE
jgi:hypothetical protein